MLRGNWSDAGSRVEVALQLRTKDREGDIGRDGLCMLLQPRPDPIGVHITSQPLAQLEVVLNQPIRALEGGL